MTFVTMLWVVIFPIIGWRYGYGEPQVSILIHKTVIQPGDQYEVAMQVETYMWHGSDATPTHSSVDSVFVLIEMSVLAALF